MQERSISVYEASNSQVPAFSVFLQSDTQVQRASSNWQRYLEAQGGSQYMCGDAGMKSRGKAIGKSFGIGLALAVALQAALEIWWGIMGRSYGGFPGFLFNVAIPLGLMIYDEYGDWTILKSLADSGNAWLLLNFGLMLFGSILLINLILSLAWLGLLVKSGWNPTKPESDMFGWVNCVLVILLVYSWVTVASGLGLVIPALKNLDAYTTCIGNKAAICKPQTQEMFSLMIKAAVPALISLHLWHGALVLIANTSKDWAVVPYLTEGLFILLESIPQASYQAYVWQRGYAYITEYNYLLSAIGSFTSIMRYAVKSSRAIQRGEP